ncbi:MAG: methionine ABC transporter ATP-binding protein [Rhodospirillales bacterium CG15_BIG_FIL_POST_REV_8_21_14_020_66_15]|nr:MAG: methionine ABC transporter ATP-binding protein [Rhodospirillales bacterium CG15_BIG_FIL_POST_REV_8_21_14_020_66_15]
MSDSAIRLSGVTFRWRPDAPLVLDIPEFAVRPGERVFVTGPSGSGKSTLLNLLAGIVLPQAGAVEIGGSDMTRLPGARRDALRADRVGYIFQMFNLLPFLSLTENVLLPCRFSAARRARAAAASGGIEGEARRLLAHMGLAGAAAEGRAVAELSTGQQQRVAVARALIGAPPVIIADEPTSALDADAQAAFLGLLFDEAARSGAAVLFVSHDRRLESGFDRIVPLADLNRAADGGARAA